MLPARNAGLRYRIDPRLRAAVSATQAHPDQRIVVHLRLRSALAGMRAHLRGVPENSRPHHMPVRLPSGHVHCRQSSESEHLPLRVPVGLEGVQGQRLQEPHQRPLQLRGLRQRLRPRRGLLQRQLRKAERRSALRVLRRQLRRVRPDMLRHPPGCSERTLLDPGHTSGLRPVLEHLRRYRNLLPAVQNAAGALLEPPLDQRLRTVRDPVCAGPGMLPPIRCGSGAMRESEHDHQLWAVQQGLHWRHLRERHLRLSHRSGELRRQMLCENLLPAPGRTARVLRRSD
jgi:hypothetical protein